jgi:hypothetical protein
MKFLSIIKSTSKELVQKFAEKINLVEYVKENYTYPQEDYLIASGTPPVFVVSDGVTLNFMKLVEDNSQYPNPSPAGEVAKIFCESVIESVKNKYEAFNSESTAQVFKEANQKVAEYNNKVGKTDISGNKTGFYSSTGSFVVVSAKKAYWASICDSFVAHFDKDMNIKFISMGVCTPYAVINGEEYMADHLEKGVFDLEEGDKIFVFTDGFENYVKNPEFQKLLLNWDDSIQERISEFSDRMIAEDVERYGHERSLIVVSI